MSCTRSVCLHTWEAGAPSLSGAVPGAPVCPGKPTPMCLSFHATLMAFSVPDLAVAAAQRSNSSLFHVLILCPAALLNSLSGSRSLFIGSAWLSVQAAVLSVSEGDGTFWSGDP